MNTIIQETMGRLLPLITTVTIAITAPPAAVSANCQAPPAGLVSWWRAEGNGNDSNGTNNAIVPPGVTYAAAEVGLGFVLDGNTNRIVVPDAPELNFNTNQDFSIEAWIQPLSNPGNYTDSSGEIMTVVSKRYNPDLLTSLGYEMFLAGGRLSLQMDDVLSEYHNYNAGPDLRDGNFHHVAITVQRSLTNGISFYVDGQMIASFDPTVTPGNLSNSEPLRIGNHPSPSLAAFYRGVIDEVSLYNRALSAGEVAAIYSAGSAGKCTSQQIASSVPAIFHFSPVMGTNGGLVTITGTNFSSIASSNIVYFGAVQANVLAASSNGLTARVPTGASYGPLTVTVGGLSAASSGFFEPTFNGGSSNIIASNFAPSFTLPTGGDPASCVIADLDGDGKPDIAFVVKDTQVVSIYQNISTNGTPLSAASFGPCVDLPFPTNGTSGLAYKLRAADLDGDGRLDLIATESGGNRVSIFHNIATPGTISSNSFAPAFALLTGSDCRFALAADMNGDGRPDVVALNYGDKTISIFQNIGDNGSLSANSFAPAVTFADPAGPYEAVVADLNSDGKPDLAIGNVDNTTISIFENIAGPGSITTNSLAPRVDLPAQDGNQALAAADIDGDGNLDLICGSYRTETITVYRNLGIGGSLTTNSFAPGVNLSTGNWTFGLAIGDLNGDGKPDISEVGQLPSTMSIFQNLSTPGTFTNTSLATRLDLGSGWNAMGVAVGDLDGDGRPDIVFCNFYDGNIQFYQNVTPFYFVPPTPPQIVSQTPSQIVLVGGTAVFGVAVSGSEPLTYQWSRNGVPISDGTNATYTLANAQLTDSGSKFSCFVTNTYGTASSTNVSLKVLDTVANDLCSGAIIITNANYTNVQSTLKASAYGDPLPSCVDGLGHGVWYQFTAPVAGRLVVDTFGSDFDTGLAIYSGSCDALTEVACDDDTVGVGVTSQVTLPTTAGATYFILAGGYQSDAGNLTLHLTHLTPPAFDVWSTNVSVVVSSNATFSPTISGSQPMTFQWFFNNLPLIDNGHITGSTSPTLVIASVLTNDGGNYQLVASNILGATTSAVAVLTPIILPPSITTPPVSQSVPQGSNVNFFAVVDGTPPYSYQWSCNGVVLTDDGNHIVGSTTSSLNISNLATSDAGTYTLTVSNLSGFTTTSATLIVMTPPVISVQPVGRSVPPGLPTIFTASASGIPAPAYQWLLNGTPLSGATSANYTNLAVSADALGFYSVIASNTIGSVTSVLAQLTFGPVAAWGRNLNNECLPPPGLTNVIAVAGNYQASYALLGDGTVTAWSTTSATNLPANFVNLAALVTDGSTGLIGLRTNGTIVTWNTSQPPPLSNVVAVAMGLNANFALRAEGTVTSWGSPGYATVPVGLNHVSAIAAGYLYALALRTNGTVVAWGTGAATNVPRNLSNVVAIASGANHGLALKGNGTVVAWGSGSGTNLPPGLTNIVAIAASSYVQTPNLCLALRANGTAVAWGDNYYGETHPPAALTNLLSVDIAAAPYHGLALVNDGTPQILQPPVGLTATMGRNVTLQAMAVGAAPLSYQWLFNGTNVPGATNASLFLPNIQFMNAGNYQLLVSNSLSTALSLPAPVTVISNSTLVLLTQATNSVTNYQGSRIVVDGITVLGSGPLNYQWFWSPTNRNYAPVLGATNDTLVLDPALAWQSGNYYLAISNTVSGITSAPVNVKILFARAWGYYAVSNPPVNVTNAVAIATASTSSPVGYGGDDYFAVGADGKVTAWANYFPLYGETNVSALSNSFVVAIAAAAQHTLALKSDGTVYAWGLGSYGQTNVPAGLNNVVAITCGGYHDLALKSDGTVVGWGGGTALYPQYNYGQATNNPAATNVVAIAAGSLHSLALRADGTVVTWGYSYDGIAPIPPNATNLIAIAAGSGFSAGLRANGTVLQWGNNIIKYPMPSDLSNVVAISASGSHCTALKNDGTVVSWGYEYSGYASNNVPSDLANVAAIASGGDQDFGQLGTRAPSFTVQPWNQTFVYNASVRLQLAGKCVGAQPMAYQWKLNGTNLPGATSDTLILTNQFLSSGLLRAIQPGAYQLVVSNAYGVAVSKPAKISSVVPLGYALNATNLNWTTTGAAPWFGQTNYTHDGIAAARSGGIGGSQETVLQATLVTNIPGNVTFWWKVSSEQYFDTLEFRVNGTVQSVISGEVNWQFVNFPLTAGTNLLQWRYSKDATYDSGLDAGFVDQVSFAPAPVISRQPSSRTNYAGTTTVFSVYAYSLDQSPLGYQWQKNGVPLSNGGNVSGVNTYYLTLMNVQDADAAVYTVVVTNSVGGSATSTPAMLTVLDSPPIITAQTGNLTNYAGSSATFSVNALGALPMNYQWTKNGKYLNSGWTSGTVTLNLANVQDADAGTYAVILTNFYGSITSAPAQLTVVDGPPVITSQPANAFARPGQSAAFSAGAIGSSPKGYQWQHQGTNLDNANSSTLTIGNAQRSNAGPYQVVITNSYGSVTSAIASLTVLRSWVVAWGDNSYGETNVPGGVGDVTAIACGHDHALALQANGTVVGWGGIPFYGAGSVPNGLSNVVAIAAGYSHSLALQSDGTVIAWGDGYNGQTAVPAGLSNVVAIAGGAYHSLALQANGQVSAWGGNDYGQTNVPPGLSNVVAIACGSAHNLALQANGTVTAWGYNGNGETNVPAGLSNVVAIAAGGDHSLAIEADGSIIAWGWDAYGQADVPAGLSNVVAVAGGVAHSLALTDNGMATIWGGNNYGQTNMPAGLSNVVAVAGGGFFNMAIQNDGSPFITTQPASQVVASNATINFSVVAMGAPSLAYQWLKNGLPLTDGGNVSGATTASLILSNAQSADMAEYSVVITNAIDCTTSAPAALLIAGGPVILIQPTGQTVGYGTNIQLSVTAMGYPAPTYQWWFNGTNLVGNNCSTLNLTGVGRAQDGTYTVSVTNAFGALLSSNAVLKVLVPQVLGSGQLLPNGSFQLLSTAADGSAIAVSDLAKFEVQATTNLVSWFTLSNALSLTNGALQLTDPAGSNCPARYYRIVQHETP